MEIQLGDKKEKDKIFTLMDDYIIIHSKGEIKKIKIPKSGSYEERKQWLDNDNIVYDVGKDVSAEIKVGDQVILTAPVKFRGLDKLTKVMQEKLGKKLIDVDILGADGKPTGIKEDIEKYFIVREEDVICKIN